MSDSNTRRLLFGIELTLFAIVLAVTGGGQIALACAALGLFVAAAGFLGVVDGPAGSTAAPAALADEGHEDHTAV